MARRKRSAPWMKLAERGPTVGDLNPMTPEEAEAVLSTAHKIMTAGDRPKEEVASHD